MQTSEHASCVDKVGTQARESGGAGAGYSTGDRLYTFTCFFFALFFSHTHIKYLAKVFVYPSRVSSNSPHCRLRVRFGLWSDPRFSKRKLKTAYWKKAGERKTTFYSSCSVSPILNGSMLLTLPLRVLSFTGDLGD